MCEILFIMSGNRCTLYLTEGQSFNPPNILNIGDLHLSGNKLCISETELAEILLIGHKKPNNEVYGIIIVTDVLTGRIYRDKIAYPMKRIHEDIAMYERHNDGNKIISYEVIGNYAKTCTQFKKTNIIKGYDPCPFNSALKSEHYGKIIIPSDPDDSRDPVWIIKEDYQAKEKDWVKGIFYDMADFLYEQCIKENSNDYKVYGSLCHIGFVNDLFDYHHQAHMSSIRQWITDIGDAYNPEIITNLKSYGPDSIYVEGFYCKDVKRLSIYCEIMFGVNRYEVAKLFVKRSPKYFLNREHEAHNMLYIGGIYAENGDYENALKYYRESIQLSSNGCRFFYQHHLDNLINHYNETGTSMLSTDF